LQALLLESRRSPTRCDESLAEKFLDQKICSPLRDGGRRDNSDSTSLSPRQQAQDAKHIQSAIKAPAFWEMKMRKTILTVLGAALIMASAMQAAAAAERHRSHRVERAPVSTTQQFWNSNAAWPMPTGRDGSRYRYDEALSPPAGR
jgi:hypothetical protein